jgi:hypothetical protein
VDTRLKPPLIHDGDDFHVFLSSEGDSKGLYVSGRTRTGFEVREQARGTSSIAFSYRLVARRKDAASQRFQKVELPKPKLQRTGLSSKPKTIPPVKLPQFAQLGSRRSSRSARSRDRRSCCSRLVVRTGRAIPSDPDNGTQQVCKLGYGLSVLRRVERGLYAPSSWALVAAFSTDIDRNCS